MNWQHHWHVWLDRHPARRLFRRTPLQRDFESGDPVRQARVRAVADAIICEMRAEKNVGES